VVVGATDLQTLQLYNLVNRSGDALKRTHNWTALQTLFTLNVGSPLETTGNVTEGSAVISSIPTTAAITAETFVVFGDSIPAAARVLSVDSLTQVTMDMVATGTATATDLTFSGPTARSWMNTTALASSRRVRGGISGRSAICRPAIIVCGHRRRR
jgi:hypothetical protein